MIQQILVRCKWRSGCKARDYCQHAIPHIEKIYSKGDFMTESCTDEHQCPFQDVMVKCMKIRSK
jgi:hypothetical protein